MIALLAQVTSDPDPAALKEWLGVALYLFGIAAAVLGVLVLWKQLREKQAETPQPFIVQGQVKYATEADLAKEIKNAHGRMNRERDEAREAIEKLTEQISKDNAALSAHLIANNNAAEARVTSMHAHLTAMPSHIIDLLAKTGAIKRH